MSTNEDKIRKTDAQRQKSLYKRRTSQGWRKGWIDPGTLDLAGRLGGIEHIPDAYAAQRAENDRLRASVEAAEKKQNEADANLQEAKAELHQLQSRPWWRLWGK